MIPLKTKVIFTFLLFEAREIHIDNSPRYLSLSVLYSEQSFLVMKLSLLLLNLLILWYYSLKYFINIFGILYKGLWTYSPLTSLPNSY